MRIQSSTSHQFSQVPHANIPRSSFDRSHGCKTTFDAGYLIPVLTDEVLPGDTFNLNMTAFARLATPLFPYMDNIYLDSFFFFVPNRLLWNNWQKFNGEQTDPGDSTDFLVPTVPAPTTTGFVAGSLFDYYGLPTEVDDISVNALYSRAYNLIYNEWFRDQNLQDSVVVDLDDGPDDPADYVVLRRGKRHDYFTSCLPWPQKGDAVDLPLGGTAPVVTTGQNPTFTTTVAIPTTQRNLYVEVGTNELQIDGAAVPATDGVKFGTTTGLQVDLSAATAATINDLRQAFQIQKLYERDARGGTRYTEILRSHFGVISPDSRLQRPEYLGGGSTPISVTPVPQTSSTASQPSPQGNLAAYGTAVMMNNGFTKSFTEHGIIIGLVCARADLNYQDGINRNFSRTDRWSYYWPALSHIGEQAVLNKEIYAQGTAADENVFGYQERYAEYRYKPNIITGNFRSNHSASLDVWHLAQDFSALPVLNDEFIVEDPPIDRIKALGDDYPDFLLDTHFKYLCVRPMPVNSVPGLIDHF